MTLLIGGFEPDPTGGDGTVGIADVTGLTDALAAKAATTTVNAALALKADKKVFSATLTNLTIDGSTATDFNSEFSTNQSWSISNLVVGKLYKGQYKNSHATNTITITNPNTPGYVVSSGLLTMGTPAGWEQPWEMLNDGTVTRLYLGTPMKVMG